MSRRRAAAPAAGARAENWRGRASGAHSRCGRSVPESRDWAGRRVGATSDWATASRSPHARVQRARPRTVGIHPPWRFRAVGRCERWCTRRSRRRALCREPASRTLRRCAKRWIAGDPRPSPDRRRITALDRGRSSGSDLDRPRARRRPGGGTPPPRPAVPLVPSSAVDLTPSVTTRYHADAHEGSR
jgi:hypothetical protein